MATDKSMKALWKTVNSDGPELDGEDIEISEEGLEKFNKAKSMASKALVLADFWRKEALKKRSNGNPSPKKSNPDPEEIAYKRQKRLNEKYDKWDFRKFTPPDDVTFLGGKLNYWLDEMMRYHQMEEIDKRLALKAMKFKSGDFVSLELERIFEQNETARNELDVTVAALRKNIASMSDPFLERRVFKELKQNFGETNAEFVKRVCDLAKYVTWDKEDKEVVKLEVIYNGCNEISVKRIADELRRGDQIGSHLGYERMIAEARLMDQERKLTGLVMKVTEEQPKGSATKEGEKKTGKKKN